MNEYYQNLSKAFPYISLNHSEFVHHDEIQTEKGLEKLRKSDHRRRTQNSYNNKNKPAVPRPQAPHYKQKKWNLPFILSSLNPSSISLEPLHELLIENNGMQGEIFGAIILQVFQLFVVAVCQVQGGLVEVSINAYAWF